MGLTKLITYGGLGASSTVWKMKAVAQGSKCDRAIYVFDGQGGSEEIDGLEIGNREGYDNKEDCCNQGDKESWGRRTKNRHRVVDENDRTGSI